LYCISLPLEKGCCSSEKRLSTTCLKRKHKKLLGANFCVDRDNQVTLALALDESIVLTQVGLSLQRGENQCSLHWSLDAEWIIPETRDVHSLKEIWVTQSPKTIIARDIVRKVAYVWFEDEDASKRRVDSRRKKQYQPRVTIENCERLISLEQHNICYLDSETRCFRWMNEDLIAQYVELGQGDVPVFSVVATCAANSSQLALLKTLNCSFAFVELCISKETPVAHPMEELGEYALEWRGWTLTKSTPEDAFYAAVERRDYILH